MTPLLHSTTTGATAAMSTPPLSTRRRTLGLCVLALAGAMAFSPAPVRAQAQAAPYPSKPVRIISPFPPGGPTDSVARLVAAKLGEALGQPFIIENRPGASGAIGSMVVAKAPPDGYTLLMGATSSHIAPYLLKTQSYDPMKDVLPIVNVGLMPFYLIVNRKVPASSLHDFITLAKKQPGHFSYASPGNGTLAHLAMEMFKERAGVDILHVPYKGSAQVVTDVMAGQVDTTFNVTPIKSDQVRMLALTAARRSADMPEVPTAAEAGLPNFELALWVGLFGPLNLPPAITERLNREVNKAMAAPEMQEQLRVANIQYTPNTPAQFASFLATDTPRWEKVIRDVGVKVD
ncbi:MAG: tripartite tricarboxylate transporter substrate binding protein [Pseudomonadota bacterium]